MTIIWCTVPEIWSATDRTFCHSWPSLVLSSPPPNPSPEDIIILQMCTINDSYMMYGSWDNERDGQDFLSFWTSFPLLPSNNPKNQKWRTKCLVTLDCFLPFYPPNNPKNQNFEKLKKSLDILSFYTSVPKIMIICYTVFKIWHVTDGIIFHFGPFFALLPP